MINEPSNASPEQIEAWAAQIWDMIREDMEAGLIPTDTTTYQGLYDAGTIDANEYDLTAEVPFGTDVATDDDPAGLAIVTAVQSLVEARYLRSATYTGPEITVGDGGTLQTGDTVTVIEWPTDDPDGYARIGVNTQGTGWEHVVPASRVTFNR